MATAVARQTLDEARTALRSGNTADPHARAAETAAQILATRPTRVINATGVLLHTNLGRAPLGPGAATAAAAALSAYGNTELDVTTGRRGGRAVYGNQLLTALTGGEAALVVNNNAGALLLALAAIAAGGNAVVSRGEEIEIGGSFRLP